MHRSVRALALAIVCVGAVASSAFADRTQVYSLQKLHCQPCGDEISRSVKSVKGVKKVAFDYLKVELTVTMADAVTDDQVVAAVEKAGFAGQPGAGNGRYDSFPDYPEGTDYALLTGNGSAVGSLDSLRVAGKYTVFDVYADWCMPCRSVDESLHKLVEGRSDVAIRRLNVVSFESALAKEMGSRLRQLPFVVVYGPDGTRQEIRGFNEKKLRAALKSAS
jgi:copper chaperone CopZ